MIVKVSAVHGLLLWSSFAAAPVAAQDPVPLYLGCFKDNSTRAMGHYAGSNYHIGSCIQYCLQQPGGGFAYAGLQAASHCFCDNDNSYETFLGAGTGCNSPCNANGATSGTICGGAWRNSVYYTRGTPTGRTNIARGGTAFQSTNLPSSNSDASKAVDGDYNSASWTNTGKDQWWQVNFSRSGQVKLVIIRTTPSNDWNRLKDINVEVVGAVDSQLKYHPGPSIAGEVIAVEFPRPTLATHLKITRPFVENYLILAEVEVYGPTEPIYLGCFKDNSTRAMGHYAIGGSNYHIDSCIEYCRNGGFSYAGLQAGSHCFCDNDNSYETFLGAETGCNHPCTASGATPGTICGGSWRNSVYYTRGTPTGGTNFARGGTATQLTTVNPSTTGATKAVDGDYNSASSTNSLNDQWWQVMFSTPGQVKRIIIRTPVDAWSGTKYINVELLGSLQQTLQLKYHPGPSIAGEVIAVEFPSTLAYGVKITRPFVANFLILAEVEAYG